jgi:hypothetical protein
VAERIDIFVVLKELQKFVADSRTASKAIEQTGEAADKTGQKAKVSWKAIAKWGGIATAAYAAQRFLRGALDTTEELGKSTLTLNRVTGMDVKTSSEWAAMMKVRGLNAKTASMAFIKVSQSLESARLGTKKSNQQLANLGVQMDMVRQKGGKDLPKDLAKLAGQMERTRTSGLKSSETLRNLGVDADVIRKGNTQEAVLEIADAFSKMPNKARRAALTQKLFGRTGRELLPVLVKGRKGIQDQLDMADRYGAALGTNTVAGVKEMIAHERELQFATTGVKVQLGTALMPAIIAVSKVLVAFARIMAPLIKNSGLFTALIVAATTAFVTYKIVMLAATVAQVAFNTTLGITGVLITGGVVLAIVALIAVVYLLIKHWGWVKKIAMDVWNWIRSHYPLLLVLVFGPLGLAIAQLIKHFDAVKRIGVAAFGAVKGAVMPVVDAVKTLVSWVQRAVDWLGKLKPPGGGLLGKAGGVAGKVWPFQHGGVVTSRRAAVVGERGPELVSLPAGATVAPMTRGQTLAMAGAGAGGPQTIVTKVYLDRRQIAEAVGSYTADKLARR